MLNLGRLAAAVTFFWQEAGYSWRSAAGQSEEAGHLQTAIALAQAEDYAKRQGWLVEWQPDEDGCIGCECGAADCDCSSGNPHEVWYAVLWSACPNCGQTLDHLASLGGICQPSDAYKRVIEAELALEARKED